MFNAGRKTSVFFVLAILFLNAGMLFASGSKEADRLAQAEQLVDEREYNSALKVLTGLLKDEPQKFDDVQQLLERIRIEKDNYNDRYEELIEIYGSDEVEAAYPMIKELEELDPSPNEATRISLVLARETAGFVFNNNRWVEIMDTASRQISGKQYSEAVETYMGGFDLSRDIFRDAGYGNIIVEEIFSRSDEMNRLSSEFVALYPELISSRAEFNSRYSLRDLPGFIQSAVEVLPDLARTAEIREDLKDLADYFIVQENSIRTNAGDDKQVHYLIYMDRLLNGRTAAEELEGITGAIDLYWNELYKDIAAASNSYSEELFSSAMSAYTEGRYDESEALFRNVLLSTENSIETLTFGNDYFESDSIYARDGLLQYDRDRMESELLYFQQENDSAQSFLTVIEKRRILAEFRNRIDALEQQPETFREAGAVIKEDLAAEVEAVESLLVSERSRLSALPGSPEGDELLEKILYTASLPMQEYISMIDGVRQSEISLTAALYEIDLDGLETEYSLAAEGVAESAELIRGVAADDVAGDAEDTEVDFEVTYKFPDQALEQLLSSERSVEELVSQIEAVGSQISSELPSIRNGAEVAAASDHAADLLERSRALLSKAVKLGDAAREQIFTAERLKQEGERRIEESKRLSRSARFAQAKERLEQAAEKFDESLSYLEDPLLRTFRDEEIPRLYEEIQVAENNLVVRQVREYLTAGKTSYSQGNFPAAQNVLIKAQSRWSDTNIEPNPEVEYWLTLTRTALSVTSGRVIAATDPLYTEMSQYLNQAKADFLRARAEYDRGRTEAADNYFSSAEQSILYVQQFFPFNEEARVLNLRISQYRDPEQFNELFRADFLEARSLIATNPQKAYIDLKDLEAIYPSYSGLQAAITEAEYASGLKVRPPDTQKLQRSSELYELAFSIVSRNVRSEFNVALSYLDEAISLNPDNDDAIRLKDRISTDVGGTAVAVMSNADQQLYNEAVSEFTAGNYLKARIIVENLLKNPVNQRNPKLMDLQERIERTR